MPLACPRFLILMLFSILAGACGSGGDDTRGPAGLGAAEVASADANGVPAANSVAAPPVLALQPVVSGLERPIHLAAPAGDSRLFIVERPGRIRIVQNGALLPAPFLDISARTIAQEESGLLSIAFHPLYATNGFFYVFYTDLDGNIAIDRFTTPVTSPNAADPQSRVRILSIPHPGGIHFGGLLAFGPGGNLYIGTGDGGEGGEGGDPPGIAQNTNSLLGKLLRINVNSTSPGQPYAIPPANPFAGSAGSRPEIWAYGLRNPWRYSIDAATGRLYIGDVGEGLREEINVASLGQAALNYGWNRMEGTECFPQAPCDKQGLVLPVLDYEHGPDGVNGCAVVGGHVYRGNAIPELRGRYFYSDFCGGWLKSFVVANGIANEQTTWPVPKIPLVYSFGQDAQNELYLLSGSGTVYRIVRQ